MFAILLLACSDTTEKTNPVVDSAAIDSASTDSATTDSASNDSGHSTDTDQGTSIDTATAEELIGTLPSEVLPPPSFFATNYDGQARNQSHLIGQPTVIWFYPAAGTYG